MEYGGVREGERTAGSIGEGAKEFYRTYSAAAEERSFASEECSAGSLRSARLHLVAEAEGETSRRAD